MTYSGPLGGIRVLEIATFIAAPFCGTILSDFGAEVIKIEQPGQGDPLRRFGTPSEVGDSYVWLSEARNKKSMTLDLRSPRGAEIFLQLAASAHVVLENFRPGTLESWGLGYDRLSEINPKLVLLRVSGYGQTGPMRRMPGFARVAHAFSGLSHLAGTPDGPPVVPGSTSLADYCSGLWGAIGVLIALRHAEASGRGQSIDIGLYESIFRLLDELAPVYQKTGAVRSRMGAEVPHVVPHGHWQTRDAKWIALACSSDKIFARLARVMDREDLIQAGAYATGEARIAGREHINAAVAKWVAALSADAIVSKCNKAGVPCGKILDIAEIFEDEQYRARGALETFEDERVGKLVIPAGMPKMSETPPSTRSLGAALGRDTEEILSRILKIDKPTIESLRKMAVI